MTRAIFDVVVAGGGAAGSATALSLRRHAPELSVAVVERTSHDELRIGETLPPHARDLLVHLGVWEAFQAEPHRAVYGTAAAWGGAELAANDFVLGGRGPGWHLDRRRFDALLAARAEAAGATFFRGSEVGVPARRRGAWEVPVSSRATLGARFFVDATGTSARPARALGARAVVLDRLVAIALFFSGGDGDPRTVVEGFRDGWWYSAGLPAGGRVGVCLTDADVARRLRLGIPEMWLEELRHTLHVSRALAGAAPEGEPVVRAVHSRRLDPARGPGWLAVGDAAATFDPLSGQGVYKALRGGIFASYAVADWLLNRDEEAVARYGRFVEAEFRAYVETRTRYYAREQRWPDSAFWRRRSPHERAIPSHAPAPPTPSRTRPPAGRSASPSR
ncbi:MAG TPA: tryptophan 7-halogenase [Actinomycetota bacterium]|nr:tryptophan 7-halogenase [Actinomycetota bacterium]